MIATRLFVVRFDDPDCPESVKVRFGAFSEANGYGPEDRRQIAALEVDDELTDDSGYAVCTVRRIA